MTKTNKTFRLGDIVTGLYHDQPFTGTLVAFDAFGVSFDVPGFVYLGMPRDGVWLRDMRSCKLVSRPDAIRVGNVHGVQFLRTGIAS